MIVNHGSTLTKEYFLSYLNLIIISRNCSVEQAKELAFELFFNNNEDNFGKETFQRFLAAFNDLNNGEMN